MHPNGSLTCPTPLGLRHLSDHTHAWWTATRDCYNKALLLTYSATAPTLTSQETPNLEISKAVINNYAILHHAIYFFNSYNHFNEYPGLSVSLDSPKPPNDIFNQIYI